MAPDVPRPGLRELIPAHVLAHVPGFSAGDATASATRLPGGTVNASYRIDTRLGHFVVRLHPATPGPPGTDRAREARLHAVAAAAGVAPALVHVDAGHRFMIMEYVPGPTWEPADFGRTGRVAQLGAALRAVHALRSPRAAPLDLAAILAQHFASLERAAPADLSWLRELKRRAAGALPACGSETREAALIHGDPHHTNLIGYERLYLLDWEYAALGDPLFDLACILAYYPQVDARALLHAAGLAGAASPQMLAQATWVYVLLSYLWYRRERGVAPAAAGEEAAAPHGGEQALERQLRARLG